MDSLDGVREVLLDPNTLSEDGTVALSTYSVSEDAKYLAYALSTSGSDWVTIKVMRIEDKKGELDTLSCVKFSGISWTHDNKGLFYSRYISSSKDSTTVCLQDLFVQSLQSVGLYTESLNELLEWEFRNGKPSPYEKVKIDEVREELAGYVLKNLID